MFHSILSDTTSTLTLQTTLLCTLTSILLGLACALIYRREDRYSKNFTVTMLILPSLVQFVIMLVNGNLGTSVAVLGTFSLVRFRSVPGSSKEICYVFLAMAIGLATGVGYIGFAFLFTVVILSILLVVGKMHLHDPLDTQKDLRITIPENLDYTEVFNDIFEQFLKKANLVKVKTTNLGSMFELHYEIELKKDVKEKEMMDAIRTRNGNLTIICSRIKITHEEL